MKKFFTILGVSAAMFANAQTNLFAGSDFNNYTEFTGSLAFPVKFAEESTNGGVNGSGALKVINNTTPQNGYIFTVDNSKLNLTGTKYISVQVKGTGGGVSFNAGNKFFNVPAGTNSNITLSGTNGNTYNGSIATNGQWITITLDVTDVDWSDTTKGFSMKLQKNSTNELYVDNILASATLAIGNTNFTKTNLVINTVVDNDIIFGEAANVSIINMAGQVVKTADVKENGRLNVSNLAKGTYVVTATVNGQAVSQKVIKK